MNWLNTVFKYGFFFPKGPEAAGALINWLNPSTASLTATLKSSIVVTALIAVEIDISAEEMWVVNRESPLSLKRSFKAAIAALLRQNKVIKIKPFCRSKGRFSS